MEPATTAPDAFLSLIRNPIKFRLFLVQKLPAAYFSGVRVKQADHERCVVSVPYKWFTKNPFRSTYFACLSMAAEMSTGVLAMAHIYERKPGVSMLVTAIEGSFHKKATGLTIFICEEGGKVKQAISHAIEYATPQSIKIKSTGRNESNELVAEFWITWSFKTKTAK